MRPLLPVVLLALAAPPGVAAEIDLFPVGDFYPPSAADPHRRGFGMQLVSVDEVGIADSGSSRFALRLGGRFGVLRFASDAAESRGWQLGIEAGFYGQFDNDNSQDNIGWDGFYGLVLSRGMGRDLAWKLGVIHTSAHIGDEIAERTGRRRIGYTREEVMAGISWSPVRSWRLYGETGWAYERRNEELQEPGRGQLGFAYEPAARLWGDRFGWYAAADLSAWEERDWEIDTAVQVGLVSRSGVRVWRLGIERYDGRPPMGEFFQDDEASLSFGLWLDL